MTSAGRSDEPSGQGIAGRKGEPFVRVEGLTKVFEASSGIVHALDALDLEIAEHEFLTVVGPSGCGKSTLLLIVSGLQEASLGRVTIDGRAVDRPYTDLGIVFQRDVLLEWRTALQNVLFQAEIRGLDRVRSRRRALELLRLVGLDGFEDRFPAELSGGMRQRVAICRALLHDAPLLLMDEPFGALDSITRDQMNIDLERIWEADRKTVLFITHSITEAVFLSDRVIVMTPRPGRIDAEVTIDLPRPRTLSMREHPDFIAHVRRIRKVFEASGVLREEDGARPTRAEADR